MYPQANKRRKLDSYLVSEVEMRMTQVDNKFDQSQFSERLARFY